ncbi:MAG: TrkH family potassium uptake protein [Clostridiales bacterium]|nr:TrkH family potassium uptake protein [Clostridiales bacterium]
MNMKSVSYILGWVLNIEAALMSLPLITSLIYNEGEGWAFAIVMAICALIGFLLTHKRPNNPNFRAREGFVATALSWIIMSFFGCLPFYFTGEIPRFIDALFETVSGFTTTGASILSDVESMSHCCMLWRCFTHWIGGMGVLVFLLAVLPMVGGTNMHLMKAESPGPVVGKLVPKVRYTARILYMLYVVLTILEFLLLMLGGMIPFEAICTAFGTAGTGGFGFRNDSFASFSGYIQWVVAIFMIIFGVNFNVYFLVFMKKFKQALRCEEMRWYLGIIAVASLLICANAYDAALTLEHNLRTSVFQVATIITTTGFATANFDVWPAFSRTLIVLLMFIGACAGSTGGGLKISRWVMSGKAMASYVGSFLHPRGVRKVRFEDKDVEDSTLHAIFVYFMGVFFIFTVSMLILALENMDLTSTFTAVAATFNNIGPGLNLVGPTCNFGFLSDLSKSVLIFDMLAGRLEVFPMLMLLYPPLWKEAYREHQRKQRRRDAMKR